MQRLANINNSEDDNEDGTCCLGFTLRSGVQVIAGLFLTLDVIIIAAINLIFIQALNHPDETTRNVFIWVYVIFWVFVLIDITANSLLFYGASKGRPRMLGIWRIYVCIGLVLQLLGFISVLTSPFNIVTFILKVANFCFHVYAFWVVGKLKRDMETHSERYVPFTQVPIE